MKRTPLKRKSTKKTYRKLVVPRGYMALRDRVWKLRSEYIRRLEDGQCFTCPTKSDWKDMQAGHFKHACLDFDDLNIHCQCVGCNKWKHGNLDVYATNLVRKYGPDVLNEIERRKWQEKTHTYDDLLKLEIYYQQKLEELCESLNK